ncbi:MAG: class I SAM-dependent methyltransferase [Thermodesulfovibrionales bacterium]|nr:class I SAM-dependent methyltransferase [Thermodesulfovibrionales bacterium]
MDTLSKEYLLDFYSSRLGLFGQRPEALRWSSRGQKARYAWITEVMGPEANASVLDYGCGFGDLFAFLKKNNHSVRYTGMDINPKLIEIAGRTHPETPFRVFDIEEEPLDEGMSFDHVVLCGVFNTRVEGASESLMNIIRLLYPHAGKALVATALPISAGQKQFDLNYIDPDMLLEFARQEVTPSAELLWNEGMDDFMLVLDKTTSARTA